jgi:transposase
MKQIPAFTVRSAAAELGVSTAQVYTWLREGTLQRVVPLGDQATGIGRPALIDASSVFALKQKRTLGTD